jgi:hypothetical protein
LDAYNPAGRPKGSRNRSTLVSRFLSTTQTLINPLTGQPEELSVKELMTLQLIRAAWQGNTRAYVALMDSAYGRVAKGEQPTSPLVPPDAAEDLSQLSADQLWQRLNQLKDLGAIDQTI